MSISARSDETKVGMARCAVPAAFSGGTLRAQGHELIAGQTPVPRLHGAGTPQRGIPTFTSVEISGLGETSDHRSGMKTLCFCRTITTPAGQSGCGKNVWNDR